MLRGIVIGLALVGGGTRADASCIEIASELGKANTLYFCESNCDHSKNYKVARNKANIQSGQIKYIYTTRQGPAKNGIVVVNITNNDSKFKQKVKVLKDKVDFACTPAGKKTVDEENSKYSRDGMDYKLYDEFHRSVAVTRNDENNFLEKKFHLQYYEKPDSIICRGNTLKNSVRPRFLFERRNDGTSSSEMAVKRSIRQVDANSAYADFGQDELSKSREVRMLNYVRADKSFSCVTFKSNKLSGPMKISIDDLSNQLVEGDFERIREGTTFTFE